MGNCCADTAYANSQFWSWLLQYVGLHQPAVWAIGGVLCRYILCGEFVFCRGWSSRLVRCRFTARLVGTHRGYCRRTGFRIGGGLGGCRRQFVAGVWLVLALWYWQRGHFYCYLHNLNHPLVPRPRALHGASNCLYGLVLGRLLDHPFVCLFDERMGVWRDHALAGGVLGGIHCAGGVVPAFSPRRSTTSRFGCRPDATVRAARR